MGIELALGLKRIQTLIRGRQCKAGAQKDQKRTQCEGAHDINFKADLSQPWSTLRPVRQITAIRGMAHGDRSSQATTWRLNALLSMRFPIEDVAALMAAVLVVLIVLL